MKKTKIIYIALATALIVGSCKQEPIKLEAPVVVVPPVVTPTKGTADFTKFVAIGNSLTAGFQAGALFTDGQKNSLGAILAQQFATVGGGAFNQPDINSVNGFNTTTTNPPVPGGPILGKLVLFDPDGSGPRAAGPAATGTPARSVTCPSAVSTPAVPGPGGELPTAFAGNKLALNNFGVPGILLGQALIAATGNPASPFFNGLWARFASAPGVKTIMEDAIAARGSFFMFFLGNNDILGYATTGGVGTIPLTPLPNFTSAYNLAIDQLLNDPNTLNSKGVLGNIPNVTTIPFFFTIRFNQITVTAEQATALNGAFGGYNGILDAIKGNPGLLALSGSTAANLDARKVTYTAGAGNRILIAEKSPEFPDLGPTFDALFGAGLITDAQRTGLQPYRRVRQATATDLITLSAGSVLGTCLNPPGNIATAIIGTTIPLPDQFVLIPSEIGAILTATAQKESIQTDRAKVL